MATFWQYLPFLIKLLSALVGTGWFAGNVALSQVGAGANLATDWWKFLVPLVVGGAGAVTTVTHHYNSTKAATAEVPSGSDVVYLGRLADSAAQRADTAALAKIGEMAVLFKQNPTAPKKP